MLRLHNKLCRLPICFFALIMLAVLTGCPATISPFNQKAYEQATSLKVEALSVMSKATEPFSKQKASVDALKLDVEKAYEYAKGRPKNEESITQWKIIIDPDRNSLFGFLRHWEEKTTLSPAFINEAKSLVAEGFDAVIELESGKRKESGAQM